MLLLLLADREGFEPSIPFRGIHDFQSCALGHSAIYPFKSNPVYTDIFIFASIFYKIVQYLFDNARFFLSKDIDFLVSRDYNAPQKPIMYIYEKRKQQNLAADDL